MSDLPRLNGLVRALEAGSTTFSLFAPAEIETAIELQPSGYDGVVFEGEHRGWDVSALRNSCSSCSIAGRSPAAVRWRLS